MTRARELLFLSCPLMINDQTSAPSSFLKEAGLAEKSYAGVENRDRPTRIVGAGFTPPADTENRKQQTGIIEVDAIDQSPVVPPIPTDVNNAYSDAVAQNRGGYGGTSAPPYSPAPTIPTGAVGANEAKAPPSFDAPESKNINAPPVAAPKNFRRMKAIVKL